MAKTVTFEIDTDLCELTVDSGTLFLGEQAPIVFAGYTPASGNTLFLSLFDKDHVTPLADNATSANTLDLRYEAMRDAFGDCKAAHSFYATVIERTSGGSWVGQVLAAGHVRVEWSPVVFDAVSGNPATLKGATGATGAALTWDMLTDAQKASLKGADGANGATGATGPQGPQGPQGIQGVAGPQGAAGANGTNGSDGADGVSPVVSVTDVIGGHKVTIVDASGTKEFTVLNGSTGAQGPQGVQGIQGLPGIQGEKGDTGDPSHALEGERMRNSPSQRQMILALKKVWTALGGTIVCLMLSLSCFAVNRDTEWQDVPPETRVGTVLDLGGGGGGGASLDTTKIKHGHDLDVGENDNFIAIGIDNKVCNSNAVVVGLHASATGECAFAFGPYAIANGPYTVALGGADAVGEGAIGIGCATLASNDCATAIGYNSKALGAASGAVGFMCAASNNYDVAMGVQATAYGGQSTAFGAAATAGGYDSFAAGFMARAFMDYSTCIGYGSLARGYSACVIGNSSFATNWSAAVGRSNDAKGPSSIAIGYGCEADETASDGVAIGNNIEISGIQSMAMGWGIRKAQRWGWDLTGASCYSRNGLAVGGHISTNAPYSVTIGQYAFAEHPHCVVISAQTNWTTSTTLGRSKGPGTIVLGVNGDDPTKIYIGEKNMRQIFNDTNGGVWDAQLQVWWTPVMSNGKLTYQATTNVNLQVQN